MSPSDWITRHEALLRALRRYDRSAFLPETDATSTDSSESTSVFTPLECNRPALSALREAADGIFPDTLDAIQTAMIEFSDTIEGLTAQPSPGDAPADASAQSQLPQVHVSTVLDAAVTALSTIDTAITAIVLSAASHSGQDSAELCGRVREAVFPIGAWAYTTLMMCFGGVLGISDLKIDFSSSDLPTSATSCSSQSVLKTGGSIPESLRTKAHVVDLLKAHCAARRAVIVAAAGKVEVALCDAMLAVMYAPVNALEGYVTSVALLSILNAATQGNKDADDQLEKRTASLSAGLGELAAARSEFVRVVEATKPPSSSTPDSAVFSALFQTFTNFVGQFYSDDGEKSVTVNRAIVCALPRCIKGDHGHLFVLVPQSSFLSALQEVYPSVDDASGIQEPGRNNADGRRLLGYSYIVVKPHLSLESLRDCMDPNNKDGPQVGDLCVALTTTSDEGMMKELSPGEGIVEELNFQQSPVLAVCGAELIEFAAPQASIDALPLARSLLFSVDRTDSAPCAAPQNEVTTGLCLVLRSRNPLRVHHAVALADFCSALPDVVSSALTSTKAASGSHGESNDDAGIVVDTMCRASMVEWQLSYNDMRRQMSEGGEAPVSIVAVTEEEFAVFAEEAVPL